MKRNNRNLLMPKDGKMYSDLWSQMTNLDRYNYLNGLVDVATLKTKYSK